MNDEAKRAAFECCLRAAEEKTQSGGHVEPVCNLIVGDMVNVGYDESRLFAKGREVILPGWFRPSKKWDIAAYENDVLVGAIELKSINSSFGNNANNRVEESIGSATDVEYATRGHLLEPTLVKPSFGYVLIISANEQSTTPKTKRLCDTPTYGIDSIFNNASYIERFTIMGQRLLEERIYQAVWVVAVDLISGEVYEPSRLMTYEKFMASVKSWIDIARA